MILKLIVIRSQNLEEVATFYRSVGLSLEYHKHGKSPFHYSASIGETVLELYPLAKGQMEADKHFRIGFGINDFEDTITRLRDLNTPFVMEATNTEFGFMAIVSDPDDRKVELYKIT